MANLRCCALINGATALGVILRDRWSNLHLAQFSDEVVKVIPIVATERDMVVSPVADSAMRRAAMRSVEP